MRFGPSVAFLLMALVLAGAALRSGANLNLDAPLVAYVPAAAALPPRISPPRAPGGGREE